MCWTWSTKISNTYPIFQFQTIKWIKMPLHLPVTEGDFRFWAVIESIIYWNPSLYQYWFRFEVWEVFCRRDKNKVELVLKLKVSHIWVVVYKVFFSITLLISYSIRDEDTWQMPINSPIVDMKLLIGLIICPKPNVLKKIYSTKQKWNNKKGAHLKCTD